MNQAIIWGNLHSFKSNMGRNERKRTMRVGARYHQFGELTLISTFIKTKEAYTVTAKHVRSIMT